MSSLGQVQSPLVANAIRRAEWTMNSLQLMSGEIGDAAEVLAACFRNGGKILVAGNGGSAADAQHFAAEFTGKLLLDRPGLPAVALGVDSSAVTAIANDYGYAAVFSRQIQALGKPGDVFVGLSTSGTSANILAALAAARDHGLRTVLLTGQGGVGASSETVLAVPSFEVPRIQEAHGVILHILAQVVESNVFQMSPDPTADPFEFLLSAGELAAFRKWITDTDQVLATTNGCFDGLHSGHFFSLRSARRQGDRLVVGLNDDDSVRRLKGQERPVVALVQRIDALRSVAAVDHVVILDGDDPRSVLEVLKPHNHCKGQEYAARNPVEADVVEAAGGRMHYLPLLAGISTTILRNSLPSNAVGGLQ